MTSNTFTMYIENCVMYSDTFTKYIGSLNVYAMIYYV
jgi:hypothetical protein